MYFANSTAPSVGFTSTDIVPRPMPFMKPSKPSLDAPVKGFTMISVVPCKTPYKETHLIILTVMIFLTLIKNELPSFNLEVKSRLFPACLM